MKKFVSPSLAKSQTASVLTLSMAALAAGLLASLTALPEARGELVYEEDLSPKSQVAPRAEDRATLRQALSASERSRATREAQAQAAATSEEDESQIVSAAPVQQQMRPQMAAPSQASAPVVAEMAPAGSTRMGDSAEDLRMMNKSELLRRQRVREELRNEDSLQERLEELRLRDERRRTDQILGVSGGATAPTGATGPASVNVPAPLYGEVQEEVIAPPVTQHPGAPTRLPKSAPASAAGASGGVQLAGVSSVMAVDQAENQSSMNAQVGLEKNEDKTAFSIMPRLGLGGMSNTGGYDIHPRFAGGVSAEIATSENISFELGYTYAEYGVSIASGNAAVQSIQNMQYYYGNNNSFETLALKQNVVDAGIKIHLLDTSSKIRPFLGGGAAYSKSYINYDQKILDMLRQYAAFGQNPLTSDYELSSYLGYLGTGVDVKVAKSVSIGFSGKYYAVLSSRENSNLNNYAFMSPGSFSPMPVMGPGNPAPEKSVVGGSMAKSNFYVLQGGVSFTF